MVRTGREKRSRTDYILGADRCLFRNVTTRDPRHNSGYDIVLGCLRGSPLSEHPNYLRRRKQLPLRLRTT